LAEYIFANDGDKKARSPGRARRKPLKPLRREGRTDSGEPVVTTLVCFTTFAREAAGALGTRLSLRPLLSRREDFLHSPGATVPRDRGGVFDRHCEEQRDEAIHQRCGGEIVDCFASLAEVYALQPFRRPGQASVASADPGSITTKVRVARSWGGNFVYSEQRWLWSLLSQDDERSVLREQR
jgi:hypothetical protein